MAGYKIVVSLKRLINVYIRLMIDFLVGKKAIYYTKYMVQPWTKKPNIVLRKHQISYNTQILFCTMQITEINLVLLVFFK